MIAARSPAVMAVSQRRRPVAAALLLAGCAAATLVFAGASAFTGVATDTFRTSRVAMESKASRIVSDNIRRNALRKRRTKVLVNGEEIRVEYKEALGAQDTDQEFDASKATGKEVTAEFTTKPFGLLRYKAGKNGKGAMVMSVGRPFFIGDESIGQAAGAGVTAGMVVKSVGGKDVQKEKFEDIVTMLGDEALANWEWTGNLRQGVPKPAIMPSSLPLAVTFAEIPGFSMA